MKRTISAFLALALILSLFPRQQARAEIVDYNIVEPLPILFVHGYNDDGGSWKKTEFYNYVQTLGSKVVSVDYGDYSRNDITSSKMDEIYSDAIARLPSGKFDIVAHSMGGLLTRHYLLNREDIRDRVRRVIMIGTPNHGSPVAFLNRIQDMIDDPEDYWSEGKNNPEIKQYRKYYQQYLDDMFDGYLGGPIPKEPYEHWLSRLEEHPLDVLQSEQVQEAGIVREETGVDPGDGKYTGKLGANVLEGGLNYRYSKAFDRYAKLAAARSYIRDERAVLLGLAGIVFDEVDGSHMAQRGKLDEATEGKEIYDEWCSLLWCQRSSAKNIVQDRLMMERFDFLYEVEENGRIGASRNFVANLFLHRLWLNESLYRSLAYQHDEYFPQYITIATVDDPWHALGRAAVDPFIIYQNVWKYEEHDSVVPVSSVTLTNWLNLNGGTDVKFLDRNVKDVPAKAWNELDDRNLNPVEWNETGYVAHASQMEATDLLRRQYDNPITGKDDAGVILKLGEGTGYLDNQKVVVLQPSNESIGHEFKIRIHSRVPVDVKLAERDGAQTWDRLIPVPVMLGDYEDRDYRYQGEFTIKTGGKVHDYMLVASDYVKISVDPVDEIGEEGQTVSVGDYPYYLQPLESSLEGDRVKQTFRVIDRTDDASMGGMDKKDLIFKLNGSPIHNPNLYVSKQTIRSVSNIMMALDYSGSMRGRPKWTSMSSAYAFIRQLEGKTEANVGVLGFTEQLKVLSGLTDQYQAASKSVFVELDGGTALYDAIVSASAMLAREKGHKSIFLMTDGEDSDSRHTMEEAVEAAKTGNAAIYILALGNVNMQVLQHLANSTGGRVAYTYTADELAGLYRTITEQQDYIYTLEYEVPDLTEENELTIAMTDNRSNKAEIVYGPLITDVLTGWFSRGRQLLDDLKEVYAA